MVDPAKPNAAEYEFTSEQNLVLATLSRRLVIVSVLVFLLSAYGFAMFLLHGGVFSLVEAIIGVVMAVTFFMPADNFRRITTTQGRDITELMRAFTELSKGWLVVNLVTAVLVAVRVVYAIRAIW